MEYQNVAITGASRGLGRALAIAYAHPGAVLHLSGRDVGRLGEVAATCRALGADARETVLDVTDRAGCEAWIRGAGRLDLVVANAGISVGPGAAHVEAPEAVRALFATNVDGVFNVVLPAMGVIAGQAVGAGGLRGRIAIVGSIAGLMALPTSPTYSATKAALDRWVSASAWNAAKDGIGLTIVRPGFVRTEMTAGNPYTMPGLMDAGEAARRIVAGLAAGRAKITFPWWLAVAARISGLAPARMFDGMARKRAG